LLDERMARISFAEQVLRATPTPIRDVVIDAAAPFRKRRAFAHPAPRWITLFITNYCNARCEHCFYWRELNSRAPEMDSAELRRVFDSLDAPVNTLRLSGGEPFLRKDLEEIVAAADAAGRIRKISIPTHGMQADLLDRLEAMVPKLRHSHLNVSISLDGLARRHDGNRKIRNGFERAIRHLRWMVEFSERNRNFHPSVSISLTRGLCVAPDGGRPELLDLISLLRDDVGLRDIGFDHIRSAETDVVGVPEAWSSGFSVPPMEENQPEERHRRQDDVQLNAEERRRVNDLLRDEMSGRSNDLTMARIDAQQEIFEQRKRLLNLPIGSPASDPNCSLHVDHILPFSKGGKTAEGNLRTLCSDCNVGRGNNYLNDSSVSGDFS
jgi:uncharacterized Fe-S cluster-containing radical SAM superfamily protein